MSKKYAVITDFSMINGMANALAYTSVTSILMKVFPQHATMVASYMEMFHGLGYLIGKTTAVITRF